MSTTTTTETELSDAEKLYQVADKTDEDGFVQVELVDWELTDSEVRLSLATPYGDTVVSAFERPKSNIDEYEIVRVLDSVGYGIASLDTACNENVNIRADPNNNWKLAPEYSRLSHRINELAEENLEGPSDTGSLGSAIGFMFVTPLAYLLTFPAIASGKGNDFAYGFFGGVSGALLWMTMVFLLLYIPYSLLGI